MGCYYRKFYSEHTGLGLLKPFNLWVQSRYYEFSVKVVGGLMVAVAAFLAYLIVRAFVVGQ